MGIDQGWELFAEKEQQKMIRLVRDGVRMDVWYTKMTVAVLPRRGAPTYHRYVTEGKLDTLLSES